MTDADTKGQESTETVPNPTLDNSGGKGENPFRSGPKPEPKPKTGIFDVDNVDEYAEEPPEEKPEEPKKPQPAKKPADKSASLEDIEDVELLRKMVKETRREAAKARTDKQAELKEFEAWKESQKSEAERAIEKAQERAAAAEKRADALLVENLQREFNIADDLTEFITGATEDDMRARAEKLKDTGPKVTSEVNEPAPPAEEARPTGPGLLGGKRGEPLNKVETTNDWFTKLMNDA